MYPLLRSEAGSHSGDNGDEDPPVPIPNTEVKLVRGESTWHIAPGRITRCRISKNKAPVFGGRFIFIVCKSSSRAREDERGNS